MTGDDEPCKVKVQFRSETDQRYQQEVADFYMLHNDKKSKKCINIFFSLSLCGLKLKASSNYSHT